MASGPLTGVTIVEMAGIGPGPYAGMLLADMGATVIRVDRTKGGQIMGGPGDVLHRSKRSIAVDLKDPEGIEVVLKLIEKADAIIEGFRPGVMEKLGLGPEVCQQRNPALVYGRMTGWGQHGPLAQTAGHDINYIAITGALDSIGRKNSGPVPPLNLVGDFGGGSLFLALGLLAGVIEARSSGKGQVVDAAISDGAISLMAPIQGFLGMGLWKPERQSNMLDGGSHYYDTYECADGLWVSIGSIEPQFYALLAEKLDMDIADNFNPLNRENWAKYKPLIAEKIKSKTRAQWCEIMEGTDVCFAPVLNMNEAPEYAHNKARESFIALGGVTQTAPAPRFDRTPSAVQNIAVAPGTNSQEILGELGLTDDEINTLLENGAVAKGKEQ